MFEVGRGQSPALECQACRPKDSFTSVVALSSVPLTTALALGFVATVSDKSVITRKL